MAICSHVVLATALCVDWSNYKHSVFSWKTNTWISVQNLLFQSKSSVWHRNKKHCLERFPGHIGTGCHGYKTLPCSIDVLCGAQTKIRLSVWDFIMYLRERLEIGAANLGLKLHTSQQYNWSHSMRGLGMRPLLFLTMPILWVVWNAPNLLFNVHYIKSSHQHQVLYSVLHYCVCSSDTDTVHVGVLLYQGVHCYG